MSNARYYVVGDRDVWMINVKESEPNRCACRNQALAFAMGAAPVVPPAAAFSSSGAARNILP